MTTDRDTTTRVVRSWLQTDEHESADRVLDAVLDRLDTTPQRRATRWPAWRLINMNNTAKVALAAVAVLAIAFLGIRVLLPAQNVGDPGPTPTPTPTPVALHSGPLAAGTYAAHPFAGPGGGYAACLEASEPDCDPAAAASVRITFTVPDGWTGFGDDENVVWLADGGAAPPGGASILFMRGSWLASDPCAEAAETPDIPVGPTVDDFASALADHPVLDTTDPVDVTLGGYSGKYMDLQTPADLAGCAFYRPWEPGIYAQGPGQRWHLWILDVDGIRVVIHADDYAETSPQHRAELQAIVDSIQIEP